MAILGIKVTPSMIWYAIAEGTKKNPGITNLTDDFRIPFPKSLSTHYEKAAYLFDEVVRIIERNQDIKSIVLKENEYTRFSEKQTSRFSSNLDGVVMAVGASKKIIVVKKLYASLGVKKAQLLNAAETVSGRTAKYWGDDIAEAVLSAVSGL